jgi:hypothetical protein
VIVIEGAQHEAPTEASMRERARALRAGGASSRDIVTVLTEELGAPRNVAYRLAHEP